MSGGRAQKPFIVPIPGTRRIDHLHENLRAAEMQLSAEELREIDTALAGVTVHGGRMNSMQMRMVDTSGPSGGSAAR